jgi:hypothetical protein
MITLYRWFLVSFQSYVTPLLCDAPLLAFALSMNFIFLFVSTEISLIYF